MAKKPRKPRKPKAAAPPQNLPTGNAGEIIPAFGTPSGNTIPVTFDQPVVTGPAPAWTANGHTCSGLRMTSPTTGVATFFGNVDGAANVNSLYGNKGVRNKSGGKCRPGAYPVTG